MDRPIWQSIYLPIALVAILFVFAFVALLISPKSDFEQVSVSPRAVADLVGWSEDQKSNAFAAFIRSCDRHSARDVGSPFSSQVREAPLQTLYGTWGDWKPICDVAESLDGSSESEIQAFFEENFVAVQIKSNGESLGLFTGYHEYHLKGAQEQSEGYATPLLRKPADLVSVNLGSFRPEWRGERIAGRLLEGALVPYETRAEIETAFDPGDVLYWAADPVDAFFLQIQGSGRMELPDGSFVMLNYAGQNGHPYTSIGRVLIDEGALAREEVTADSIKDWLRANKDEANRIMHMNASYVFFRELEAQDPHLGPPGAQDVPLTPERSLAVDLRYHALGVPIWLQTDIPDPNDPNKSLRLERLMVSQDTGGAIRGPIRGDVFWGFGAFAEAMAGNMKHQGSIHVLVPKRLAAALD